MMSKNNLSNFSPDLDIYNATDMINTDMSRTDINYY